MTTPKVEASGAIFPRDFKRSYPIAARGEGVYLYDETGKQYLDACAGAAVVSIGHGVQEIVDAMASQASQVAYAHSSQFHTRAAIELAGHLRTKFPGAEDIRVFFTSGGSEATETAIKIARQYWLSRSEPQRDRMIARWHGYHGATMGALGLSGNRRRREAYRSLLAPVDHIVPCFCYRCPLGKTYPSCAVACADDLERAILANGAGTVAAFILEPVVGATSGAAPPDGYLQRIREICDQYGILLIADEVMTGGGRTGKYFAVEHWGVVPDIILLGKGLTSGYAPLGAALVTERVWKTIARGGGSLEHGFTYQCHPPSVAAGLAVQRFIDAHGLVERSRERGVYLTERLETLKSLPGIGDVRGKGLLQVIEFVSDPVAKTPFPQEAGVADRVFEALRDQGVLVYPGKGTADGFAGDHILIAPPFIIEERQIDLLSERIEAVAREIARVA
jgi:adenosylmethionine-8-amino-7-oxononanoate aminotransferase